jgi:hypothetical protein
LFLIGRFLKIFSSETAWPMNQNLGGSIYGRSNVKSKRMTDEGYQVMAKAHIAFGKVC